MKKIFRLTGTALTVASAAMLTACTSTSTTTRANLDSGRFDAASVSADDIRSAPVDQTKRRPDTHPELRSGLWQFSQLNEGTESFPSVVETTVVEADEPGEANDTTALLAYNPEVINVAQARSGDEIIEASAAGRTDADIDVDVDADADTGIRTNIDADRNDSSSIDRDGAGAAVSGSIGGASAGASISADAETTTGTTIRESSGAGTQEDLNRLRGNERNRLDTDPNRNNRLEAAGSTTTTTTTSSTRCECCGQLKHTSK